MGIIIDICIVAVLVLAIFIGYKRGLVGVAFKIVSFVIAILISLILYYPITNFIIEHTEFDNKIEQTITNRFIQDEKEDTKKESNNLISKQIENVAEEAKENSIAIVAKNMSRTIISFIVMIIIYIITRIILFFFRFLSDKLAEIPIIKQFNEAGGIAYGIITGFLVIYVVFAIIGLTSSLYNSENFIYAINSSFIGRIIYDNNLILKLFF